MVPAEKPQVGSKRKLLAIVAAGLVLVVAAVVFAMRGQGSAPTETKLTPPPRQPSVYSYARPQTLAVAQRRGRCRAMNLHLARLARATKEQEAEGEVRALELLAGEMLNGYPIQPQQDTASLALPVVGTSEGQRGLLKARDELRERLRSVRDLAGGKAATRVAEGCNGCHAQFMRDGGRGMVLPARNQNGIDAPVASMNPPARARDHLTQ